MIYNKIFDKQTQPLVADDIVASMPGYNVLWNRLPIVKSFDILGLKDFIIKDYEPNLDVIFSTHPWDIITMSMRGVSSCMRWSADKCTHLVGSVLDSYLGIIFTTTREQTDYGSKMISRSIVRLVRSKDKVANQSPPFSLFIEKTYANNNNNYTRDAYKQILSNKCTSPLISKDIVNVEHCDNFYIQDKRNITLEHKYRSYIDSTLTYGR